MELELHDCNPDLSIVECLALFAYSVYVDSSVFVSTVFTYSVWIVGLIDAHKPHKKLPLPNVVW